MMSFYNNNQDYINKTINIDLKEQYQMFLKYLKKGASILDVGFGSGRDMLVFRDLGYFVSGIDNEPYFVTNALKMGLNVEIGDILTYSSNKTYDAIWANASLVHFSLDNIKKAIINLKKLLNDDGVMYISFKYGDFIGYDSNNRFFTYINEERLESLNLNILERNITKSKNENNLLWLNLIIRK